MEVEMGENEKGESSVDRTATLGNWVGPEGSGVEVKGLLGCVRISILERRAAR